MIDYANEDGWPDFTKRGWTPAEFDEDAATHSFSPDEVKLLLELVDRTKTLDLDTTDITRETFDHPDLHGAFADWSKRLKWGQGLLKLRGFPVGERSVDDIWRMYWGIGSHFGIGVSQNANGQILGKVAVQPDVVGFRVYGTSDMAALHSDRIDFLSLLCINKAKEGGENVFVSSLKLWETVEAERPDLFALLQRGYPQHRNGEEPEGASPVTPYRVPLFGEVAGLRSCYLGGNGGLSHQEKYFGEILDDADREALTFVRAVAARPELGIRQKLEPGEAVFINNMEMLHSRTAFVDGDEPSEKRLLLRMWLQGRPCRPIPRDMRVINNPSGMLGIEPKPSLAATAAD